MTRPRRQRGAALLVAMMTVALVATFAASAVWQQWRAAEVEAAERWRSQSAWLLTGALDWARLILREDWRGSGAVDHLAEPWAVPLQEARLSTFLAADPSNNVVGDDEGANVFLSGQIQDLQAFLNVNSIIEAGVVKPERLRPFQRLFELLGLPQAQLSRMAENLRFANDISTDNRNAQRAALAPQRVEQLVWLGLSPEVVRAITPYVTVLPGQTRVNFNTASAEVLYAVGENLSMADAHRLVAERERQHFRQLQDINKLLNRVDSAFPSEQVAAFSHYFEIRGHLRMDDVVIEQRSVVRRDSMDVRPVQRDQGVFEAAPPLPR